MSSDASTQVSSPTEPVQPAVSEQPAEKAEQPVEKPAPVEQSASAEKSAPVPTLVPETPPPSPLVEESLVDKLLHVAEDIVKIMSPRSAPQKEADVEVEKAAAEKAAAEKEAAEKAAAEKAAAEKAAAEKAAAEKAKIDEENSLVSPLSTILTICGRALQGNMSISPNNIVSVIHSVMEAIESLKTLAMLKGISGKQKKQLALDCLHWLINNHTDVPDEEKALLNKMVDSMAPAAIDVIISVSNGISDLVETKVGCLEINTNHKLKVHTKTSSCCIM